MPHSRKDYVTKILNTPYKIERVHALPFKSIGKVPQFVNIIIKI